jgi:hypothetical protein
MLRTAVIRPRISLWLGMWRHHRPPLRSASAGAVITPTAPDAHVHLP